MADETVTIHAARMNTAGDMFVQREQGGLWYFGYGRLSQREMDQHETRPVRIATTDRAWDGVPKAWTEGYAAGRAEALDDEGATLEVVRVGLDADQHIRAHALGPINVHIHPEADYPDEKAAGRAAVAIAQQLAAWIRDGEVPSDSAEAKPQP